MVVKLFFFARERDALEARLDICGIDLREAVAEHGQPGFELSPGPTNSPWQARGPAGERLGVPPSARLGYGVPLRFKDRNAARGYLRQMRRKAAAAGKPDAARVCDVELTPAAMSLAPRGVHWCAGRGQGTRFADRRRARALIAADALRAAKLTGAGVNLFVIDQGISRAYLSALGGDYGGGMSWIADGKQKLPGSWEDVETPGPLGHGAMLLRSVLDLAPEVRIFDLPLLPGRIDRVEYFALSALFAFAFLDAVFLSHGGRWVLLNAWGVVDRFGETLRGFYTADPEHPLNRLIAGIASRHDVVFAAGNSGQFCAEPRVPGYDRGPGRSIFGANALDEVLSVGAVRTDGAWIGASSQGPGPEGFSAGGPSRKPDLCAPSWFAEDRDAALRSGGTSAASAVAAGVIAALRQGWSVDALPVRDLHAALRGGARQVGRSPWSERTGRGILNVQGTMSQLP